jgi:hypothetical protein
LPKPVKLLDSIESKLGLVTNPRKHYISASSLVCGQDCGKHIPAIKAS